MTDYVILDQQEHANLKVKTERAEALGDRVQYVMTFPFEFRNIQAHYPIFFQKDADTGAFFPLALLGFESDENLFLSEQGWSVPYVPVMIKRQPFLIGFQGDENDPEVRTPVVSLDMDNPRVNESEGEPLFLEHGGHSEFLQNISGTLELIHQGNEHSKKFVQALIDNDLLESVTLNVELNDGSDNQLLGYYTVNENTVQQLSAEKLGELNEQGFLQPIFMIIASHSCLRNLIDEKNSRRAKGV
jgi:hypothetical protein